MTFLNPWVLLGLAAAAIPVLIHLLHLRRLRTIDFSSLRFLKELQKSSLRRLRLRQILLLVVRTLIVTTLVLAFSRPVLRGSLALLPGTRAAGTMIMMLDDSPSMGIRNQHGTLFSQAQQVAIHILSAADEGDRFHIVPLSALPISPDAPAATPSTAKATIAQQSVSALSVPFEEGFARARAMLARSPLANAEICLITDGQAAQFRTAPGQSDSIPVPDQRTRVFLVTIPRGRAENVGIGSFAVQTRIMARDKPATVETVVRNHGASPLANSLVSVYLDGTRVAQQAVTIGPSSSTTVQFSVIPKRRGFLTGYLQLEDDPLEIDNRHYFVLAVPKNIRVLLVGPSPEGMRFTRAALTLAGDTSIAGLLTVEEHTEDHLATLDLARIDVLVSCGVVDVTPTEADRVARFVRDGGSLFLFPGPRSDVGNYNNILLKTLGLPPAVLTGKPPGTAEGDWQESGPYVTFATIDYAHPLFAGMFEAPVGRKDFTPSIESPKVRLSFGPQSATGGRSIITLTDGVPFLSEYSIGTGKVFLCAVEPGVTWSDFPVKGIFAPLVHRAMAYLATGGPAPTGAIAGERIESVAKVRDVAGYTRYVILSPSGVEERVIPTFLTAPGVARFTSSPTTEVGVYSILRARGEGSAGGGSQPDILQAVPVNCEPAESDLTAVSGEKLEEFWKRTGIAPSSVRQVTSDESVASIIRESRFGIELWKYCVGLAVVLALVEMMLGREPRQKRGVEVEP